MTVTALAVITQAVILVALFLGVRRMQAKIELLLDRDVQPLLAQTRELVAEGRKTIDKVNATVDEVSGFAKTQAGRLDLLMADAVDRARLQLIRADQLISDAMTRIEKTTEQVQRSIAGPIREIQAVLAGVRAALDFLVGSRRRATGPVNRPTQDEELFI